MDELRREGVVRSALPNGSENVGTEIELKKSRVGRKRIHLHSSHYAYTPVETPKAEEGVLTEGSSLLATSVRTSKKPDPATFPWYHASRFPYRFLLLVTSAGRYVKRANFEDLI